MSGRHIRTTLLDIAVLDDGPADGPVVLLLHGCPDDATTWAGIAPRLNAAGLRSIAPYLRGFGALRFLSDDTPRTGNSGILKYFPVRPVHGRYAVDGSFVAMPLRLDAP